VRRAAIGAATYPAWREFGPRLEILVEHDDDERVRDLAQRALAAFRANEWA
jgi:heme oxygenase